MIITIKKSYIDGLLLATSKDDTRYYLQGIHVAFKPRYRGLFEATDGTVAVRYQGNISEASYDAIWDKTSLEFKTDRNTEMLVVDTELKTVTYGFLTKPLSVIDGQYPDLNKCYEENQHVECISFDTKQLNRLYKIHSNFNTNDSFIVFNFTGKTTPTKFGDCEGTYEGLLMPRRV